MGATCGCMPPVITRSAQRISASSRGSAFRLMSRNSHVWGRRAASVIKPSGGAGQRAPAASQAAPKLQNEFGLKSGKTRRIFVGVNISFASSSVGQRCRSKSAKLYNGGINDAPFQAEVQSFLDYLHGFFSQNL